MTEYFIEKPEQIKVSLTRRSSAGAELSVRGAGDVLHRISRRIAGNRPEDPAMSM